MKHVSQSSEPALASRALVECGECVCVFSLLSLCAHAPFVTRACV